MNFLGRYIAKRKMFMTPLEGTQRQYRAVTLAFLSSVIAIVVMRLIVSYGMVGASGTVTDTTFTLFIQLVFNVGVPFLIYRLYLGQDVRAVCAASNIRPCKWYLLLLCIPLGVCLYVFNTVVVSIGSTILRAMGYHYSSSAMPDVMNGGLFTLDIILTAILPAICEEFIMRGQLLTTTRKCHNLLVTCLIGGVMFALLHESAAQFYYTFFVGMFFCFMTLKFKSIYPAMILHFMNNFINVYLQYSEAYGFWGSNVQTYLNSIPFIYQFLYYFFMIVAGVGIVFVMLFLRAKDVDERKLEVVKDSAFDNTHNRVVLFGELNEKKVEELEMTELVYGEKRTGIEFKPSLRDRMFLIGAITVAALETVMSLIRGIIV